MYADIKELEDQIAALQKRVDGLRDDTETTLITLTNGIERVAKAVCTLQEIMLKSMTFGGEESKL